MDGPPKRTDSPDFLKLAWLDLPLPKSMRTPIYVEKIEERGIINGKLGLDSGHAPDHEPEFVYRTEHKTITPTTDCVLKEGSLEGHEVFINTFEFHVEEDHTVHQIFLKSSSRYLSANLYCDGKFMLDWYQDQDDLIALLNMTPRQNDMYTKMVEPRKAAWGSQEVLYTIPLRAGTSSEETFRAMSKLYKNWKIEYEFSDQIPGTTLYVGFIVQKSAQ